MRLPAVCILASMVFLTACPRTPEPPAVVGVEVPGEPAPPALAPDEAVGRLLEPDPHRNTWGWERLTFEIRCGGPGSLELLWGDRLDIGASGEGSSKGHSSTVSTIEAGTFSVEFAWRLQPGRVVLEEYLKPIGGPEALAAVRRAVPGIDEATLGRIRLLRSSKSGSTSSASAVQPQSMPPEGATSMTTSQSVGTEFALPAGKQVLLWQRIWSVSSGVSTSTTIGPEGHRIEVDGKEIPLSEYPLPVWSLHVRFTPQ